MSDTPRTDIWIDNGMHVDRKWGGLFNHARTLERELSAKSAECQRLREALQGMVNAFAPNAENTVALSGAETLQSDVRRALQALGCLLPDEQARAALREQQP